jgi:hypothetical protein
MKISFASLLAVLAVSSALYIEETGVNDFTISTTGHGAPTFVHSSSFSSVVTSSLECTVASRAADTGKLLWRREVCTAAGASSHIMTVSGDQFYTADDDVVRAWSTDNGALLWDAPPSGGVTSGLWTAASGARTIVGSTAGSSTTLALHNAANGRDLGSIEGSGGSTWVGLVSGEEGSISALTAGSVSGAGVAKDLSLVSLTLSLDDGATAGEAKRLSHAKDAFVLSSLQIKGNTAFALTTNGKLLRFSLTSSETSETSGLDHPLWTSVESMQVLADDMIRVTGSDNRYSPAKSSVALFVNRGSGAWTQVYGDSEESQYEGIAHCASANLVVAASGGVLKAYDSSSKSPLKSLKIDVEAKDVVSMETVSCEADSVSVLVSTSKLSSELVSVSTDGTTTTIWSTEDGLSTVSSALLLDAVHTTDLSEDEEAAVMNNISLVSRLESQMEAGINLFAHLVTVSKTRNDDFGFVKVAVLLSQKLNRIWGLPTTGPTRGEIEWKLDLPSDAKWHTMVHGAASASAIVHGINGGTHSPDVLVLSSKSDETVWSCVDGRTGEVHATGSSAASAAVAQIVPVFGGGACRQVAVLIHEDETVSVVPDDAKSMATVAKEMQKSQNGFYNHVINRETNALDTYTLMADDNGGFNLQRVAHTGFTGEKIMQVGYPHRDEVIQSPSSLLGDDSILLKYLNPHIAVIITMSDTTQDKADPLAAALSLKSTTAKRKPLGATPSGDTTSEPLAGEDEPNLFVNIVDTVSGRILHRVSHANAAPDSKIPTLITENWIIYAFFNAKSRRTEMGVLTLYEGMIDKTGLTAFTSPEQALSFSSLDPRESKPVVLSKTYAIVKPITALGVTSTRAGISTRQILVASADDRITAVGRHLLEPRRPTGKVKETEKAEGLYQYSPLVPLVSMSSPSYNQTVQDVSTIVSSPTALESQSLILAFGGPDVFFSRVSPSKGFDLLPETFNRPLLSIVVAALVGVVIVVRNRSQKKTVMNGWA